MEAIFQSHQSVSNFMPGKYGIIGALLCKYITAGGNAGFYSYQQYEQWKC